MTTATTSNTTGMATIFLVLNLAACSPPATGTVGAIALDATDAAPSFAFDGSDLVDVSGDVDDVGLDVDDVDLETQDATLDDDISDAEVATVPEPYPTGADACEALYRQICAHYTDGCGTASSVALCMTRFTRERSLCGAELDKGLYAAGGAIAPDLLEGCTDELGAQCHEYKTIQPQCLRRAALGDVSEGTSCVSNYGCGEGKWCFQFGSFCGHCLALGTTSGGCNFQGYAGLCAEGFECSPSAQCEPVIEQGGSCGAFGTQCPAGQFCYEQECVSQDEFFATCPSQSSAEVCVGWAQCAPEQLAWDAPVACAYRYHAFALEGAACSQPAAVPPLASGSTIAFKRSCQHGLVCRDGVCVPYVSQGGPCSSSSQCEEGLACHGLTETCEAMQVGDPCGGTGCGEGLFCYLGSCKVLGQIGDGCGFASHCVSGFCDETSQTCQELCPVSSP